MPVDVEKLKRDLSEALTALALGKGYLGIDALADDLEKLGTDYRYLAQAVRSAGQDAGGLAAAISKAINKLEADPPGAGTESQEKP